MQRNYTLNADLRIVVTTEYPFNEKNPFYDFPDDFDFAQQYDYKIIDGVLTYDPLPVPTPEPTPQEDTDALLADHEERLIYLELGVTE